MLLSSCPKCNAQFKVAPEQLNVRQGRVMCGRCRHVFNAFESLKRVEDENTVETVDYSIIDSSRSRSTEIAVPNEAVNAAIKKQTATPVEADRPTEQWTDPLILPPRPDAPPPAEWSGGAFVHSNGVDDVVAPDDISDSSTTPPDHFVSSANDSISSVSVEIVDPKQANPVFATDNPLITGALPAPRSHGNSILWCTLTGLGFIILSLQALYFYRSEVVQQFPPLRPHLVDACQIIGCTVPWGRDQSAIKIEASDLIEPLGKPGRILLTATIANRASTQQNFPSLDVKLMDASNVVLASRIFTPNEYLGRTPSPAESIAPNAEIYVNLNLELIGKSAATGYALQAFYP